MGKGRKGGKVEGPLFSETLGGKEGGGDEKSDPDIPPIWILRAGTKEKKGRGRGFGRPDACKRGGGKREQGSAVSFSVAGPDKEERRDGGAC